MEPLSIKELTNLPVVDLGEIYLRPVEYEDYKDIFEYASDDEVTKTLAEICPEDPIEYDFALTRFGIRDDMDMKEMFELFDTCKS